MVYNMVMLVVSVANIKAKLSEYLDRAVAGERVLICRHNKPVAELRAVSDVRTVSRPIGPLPGRPTFDVAAEFFDPMPAAELERWDGADAQRSAQHRVARTEGNSPCVACRRINRAFPRARAAQDEAPVMKLLLDTCTFLWLAGGRSLSAQAESFIRDPSHEVLLSAVSVWEIATKHKAGKLPLPEPPERLIPTERRLRGVDTLAFDEDAALVVSRLPMLHHDPFDRMLISQAIAHGLAIVTPDPQVSQYPSASSGSKLEAVREAVPKIHLRQLIARR